MFRMILGSIRESFSDAGKLLRASFDGRIGETIESKPVFGMFGFQSRPRKGARCVTLRDGETFVILGGDDARYRFALEEGDAVLYADDKNWVKVKGDGSGIEVHGKKVAIGNETLRKLVDERILEAFANHIHVTPAGNSGTPVVLPIAGGEPSALDVSSYKTSILEAC